MNYEFTALKATRVVSRLCQKILPYHVLNCRICPNGKALITICPKKLTTLLLLWIGTKMAVPSPTVKNGTYFHLNQKQ